MHYCPMCVYLFYLMYTNTERLTGSFIIQMRKLRLRCASGKELLVLILSTLPCCLHDPSLQLFHLLIFHNICVVLSDLLELIYLS